MFERPEFSLTTNDKELTEAPHPPLDYAREAQLGEETASDPIPLERQEELAENHQRGSIEASEELLDLYEPYIFRQARNLLREAGRTDDENLYEDLIQEGRIAVLEVASHYQIGKGTLTQSVNVYSTRKMKLSLHRTLTPFYAPETTLEDLDTFDQQVANGSVNADLMKKRYEVGSETTLKAVRDIHFIKRVINSFSLQEVEELENTEDIKDIGIDNTSLSYEQPEYKDIEIAQLAQELRDSLSEKDYEFFEARNGLSGGSRLTIQQMAEKFGIDINEVRRKEPLILRKLRQSRAGRILSTMIKD